MRFSIVVMPVLAAFALASSQEQRDLEQRGLSGAIAKLQLAVANLTKLNVTGAVDEVENALSEIAKTTA